MMLVVSISSTNCFITKNSFQQLTELTLAASIQLNSLHCLVQQLWIQAGYSRICSPSGIDGRVKGKQRLPSPVSEDVSVLFKTTCFSAVVHEPEQILPHVYLQLTETKVVQAQDCLKVNALRWKYYHWQYRDDPTPPSARYKVPVLHNGPPQLFIQKHVKMNQNST